MNNKVFAAAWAEEIKAEAEATRKCLQRIPETLFDYKPHPKSMNLGYLALLVAEIPLWVSAMIELGEIDFATFSHQEATTTDALVQHFEENLQKAQKSLAAATEEQLGKTFSLKANGELLYSSPMVESIPSTINHWVHHRGQLTVYMRLNDIPVPSIYGPSADDKQFKKS